MNKTIMCVAIACLLVSIQNKINTFPLLRRSGARPRGARTTRDGATLRQHPDTRTHTYVSGGSESQQLLIFFVACCWRMKYNLAPWSVPSPFPPILPCTARTKDPHARHTAGQHTAPPLTHTHAPPVPALSLTFSCFGTSPRSGRESRYPGAWWRCIFLRAGAPDSLWFRTSCAWTPP